MDIMLWKAAAALSPIFTPVGSTAGSQTLEGCEQIRSLQVTAVRSCNTQIKSGSPSSGSHAPPTGSTIEAPNGTGSLPLLLPPSRSLIPSTLKFLWFNKKGQESAGEKNEMDLFLGMTDPCSSDDNDEASACTKDCTKDCWMEINDCGRDKAPNIASQGMGVEVSDETTCADLEQVTKLDEKMGKNVEQKFNPLDDRKTRNWLRRLLALTSSWQYSKTQALSSNKNLTAGDESTESKPIAGSTKKVGCCSGCEFDSLHGCILEVPHTRVVHNRESFSKFLQHASLFDMKVIFQMSFLCNLAYSIPDIKPGELLKYHKLRFATSSLDMKAEVAAKAKTTSEEDRKAKITNGEKSNKSSKSSHSGTVDNNNSGEDIRSADSVIPAAASKLATAFGSHRQPSNFRKDELVACEGKPTPNQEQSLINADCQVTSDMVDECSKKLSDGSPMEKSVEGQGSLEAASLMAETPVTAVVVAEETKQVVAKDLQSLQSCPCEWFVCDDSASHNRLFVIQGSESLASWQANLFFEPTKFEGLGVLVHRGIYEAAKGLYDQILPEVLTHLKAHGALAQVRFTGHSLGGSLSTLVALMLLTRGVLPRHAFLPVITFGAPCIMCGGDLLLQKLDLPPNQIQSVIMHRDIVPRAFACDYPDHVAQVLKRLNDSFRDHPCLNQQRLLYAPMGQILVLQPEEKQAPAHPLLPSGSGLYLLRNFMNGYDINSATQLRAAQRALLNMPHPLEILSDPGAYGVDGAVSRNHNPCSYSEAINVILHQELKRSRRLQREQRRQLWWPLVTAESSLLVQKGLKSGLTIEGSRSTGALSPAIAKSPLRSRHVATERFEFMVGRSYVSIPFKESISRYARLVASKHVQIGMLLIFSVRLLIVEGISLFIVRI